MGCNMDDSRDHLELVFELDSLKAENGRLRSQNTGLIEEVQQLKRRLLVYEPQNAETNLLDALRESSVHLSYCDTELNYVWATDYFDRYSHEERKGKHVTDVFPVGTKGLDDFILLNKKALSSGNSQMDYIRMVLPEGANYNWLVMAKPSLDQNQNPIGVLTTCVDVTQSQSGVGFRDRTTECELREAVRLTEDAIRAKNIFLAIMSHEIRTPLNGLLGLAGALESTDLNKEQRELLTAITSSGTIIADILGDILDLASMESGAMQLEARPFRPAEVVEEVVKMAVAATHEKGLKVSSHVGIDLPEMLVGDGMRVRQVMKYLVLNAIKFTQQGSVHIGLDSKPISNPPGTDAIYEKHSEHPNDGNRWLWCQVVDTGAGIPKEAFPMLFDNFSQLNSTTTRSHGGTGLGLALCKQLVELMGGCLTVASEVGEGSVFTFSVLCKPYDRHHSPRIITNTGFARQDNQRTGVEVSSRKAPRILLAEDNKVNVMVAISMLKRLGFTAQVVANGVEALEAIRKEKYDLVLLDVCMPLMDGLQVAYAVRKFEQTGKWPEGLWDELSNEADCSDHQVQLSEDLKTMERAQRIPIIAVTANALRSDVEKCFAHGMDAFIPKPVMFQKLREILQQYLPVQDGPVQQFDGSCSEVQVPGSPLSKSIFASMNR